ncbi:MAG: choice-of-anchor Q domain-containing protein, partial [Acidimicrobiales bacterium]
LPTTEPPGTLSVEASVLGDNTQAVPACVLQTATVTSTGYDFDADDSCGIGGGVGDIVSGGDPMLAPLASQSAFTDVRVQLRGSPLTDVIPSGAPQCQTRDQNWRDRPAGSGCDIGASETSGFPSGGGPIVPVAPERIVDTRVGTGGLTPLGATAQSLMVAGTHGIPADATAVVLDITGTDVLTPTFITAYPGGSGPVPNASTLNLATGQTAANMAVVKLGAGGAVRFANAHGTVNLVVDVVGYVLPESSNVESMYETTPPTRLADSRDHTVLTTFAPHSTQSLVVAGGASPVPAAATAVMVNITATDVSSPSFITAYPKGISRPTASNLNIDRHETRAVAALVKVGADRSIALFNDSGTLDLVVDVVGYVGGDNRYVGLPPRRLIDTRASGHIGPLHPFGPDEHQPFAVVGDAIPDQVKAVVLNVTVTDSVTGTFVTAYPTPIGPDLGPPNVSNVNVGPDQTNPNLVVVEVGAGGKISLYNKLGSADVVVDLVGYFW